MGLVPGFTVAVAAPGVSLTAAAVWVPNVPTELVACGIGNGKSPAPVGVVAGAVEAGRSQAVNKAPNIKTTNKTSDILLLMLFLLVLAYVSARLATKTTLGQLITRATAADISGIDDGFPE